MLQDVEWCEIDGDLKPVLKRGDNKIVGTWAPQPGSQTAILECPVFEALIESNRGAGKTDSLLMDFGQHVGQGYGSDWVGIIFRRQHKELKDIIAKSLKWFNAIWGDRAQYNKADYFWEWSTGERLLFRHMKDPEDYWDYHGHSYPFIGWEELTTWPDAQCLKRMFSCCRSTRAGMPRKVRSTTNPYGVGHNWVKARYRLPVKPGHTVGEIITDSKDLRGKLEPPRVAIHAQLAENVILLKADPDYLQRIASGARNPQEYKAWVDGDWNIVSGGMFDDVWDEAIHMIKPFPIPKEWPIYRSFDWGSSKPFSIGYHTITDGGIAPNGITYPKGTIIRIAEWYGCVEGMPNEGLKMTAADIAVEGLALERGKFGFGDRVQAGPAGTDIFVEVNGTMIARDMKRKGMAFRPADTRPGSRKTGWDKYRSRLKAAKKYPWEDPLYLVFDTCTDYKRTVPSLPRDPKDPDDVDTEAEDHIGDESRGMVTWEPPVIEMQKIGGL